MIECSVCGKRGDPRAMRKCPMCGNMLCDDCAERNNGLCENCAGDEEDEF